MRLFCLYIVVISIFFLPSRTSNPHNFLEGHWDMTNGEQAMVFEGDSMLHWIFHGPFLDDTFTVKYDFDTTTQPDRINLFDFDRGILKDKILIGIIEPHGQDSILLDFKPVDSWAEADSARPKSFDPVQLRYLVRK